MGSWVTWNSIIGTLVAPRLILCDGSKGNLAKRGLAQPKHSERVTEGVTSKSGESVHRPARRRWQTERGGGGRGGKHTEEWRRMLLHGAESNAVHKHTQQPKLRPRHTPWLRPTFQRVHYDTLQTGRARPRPDGVEVSSPQRQHPPLTQPRLSDPDTDDDPNHLSSSSPNQLPCGTKFGSPLHSLAVASNWGYYENGVPQGKDFVFRNHHQTDITEGAQSKDSRGWYSLIWLSLQRS